MGVSKHIDHIVQHPESFGLNSGVVMAVYAKHNEQVGVEGRAREELILQVINHGFIRVRFYKNSRWSITLYDNRVNKNILRKWAQMPSVQKDKYMPVHILDIHTEKVNKNYTVDNLAKGDHLTEGEYFDIELTPVSNAKDL